MYGRGKKMLVVVDNKYTYECNFKVEIGDKVYLPAPFFFRKMLDRRNYSIDK